MPADADSFVVQLDGQAATQADLAPLAFAGYAHFTALQVRGRRVRGLDLHLRRLRTASQTLFGQALPDEEIRARLRAAIQAGPADQSLTATLYSPAGEFTVAGPDARPRVLVRTGPPAGGPAGPLALATVAHERLVPAVKHVGEAAKTYYLRQAAEAGYDDVAFVDRQGRLSEASIWNLAFWDGEAVVWPEADMLIGTTMGMVQPQLARMGVPQRTRPIAPADVAGLQGAAVMNSWTPGIAVSRVADIALPPAHAFIERLHRAYQAEPLADV